jgi:VWFA-related protein
VLFLRTFAAWRARIGARIAAVACGVFGLGSLLLVGAPLPSPPTIEDSTGVVRVTAVVTDRRDQLLRNLKASDFEVVVDGQPQAVDGVELVAGNTSPRTFVFLLDEFHTAAEDSAAIRTALQRFVDTRLRPGDLTVVFKPLDPVTSIKPSADRGELHRAIETFEGRKGDYAPRTAFERNYMAQAPAAVQAARAQIVTSALRAIATAIPEFAARQPGVIVLISDGFERTRTGRDLPASLQSVVRIVNRADAPVYAFAPSLLRPVEAEGAPPPDPAFVALRSLTTESGGRLFAGPAEREAGLTRMMNDLDGHYVVSYRASHGNDGRFHMLQVGVKRPGAQVRSRTGYVAPISETMRAALAPPSTAPLRVLRRSPLIQSWSGITPTEAGRAVVIVTWVASATWAPTVTPTPPKPPASTVIITASTPDGTVLFDGPVGPTGDPVSPGVPNHASFDAPVGPVRVDMKILDVKGVVLDTDARDLTVPKPQSAGPTIYSPAVLRARSAREFRDLEGDPNAAPVPTRDFRRTDRLLIRVPALDASGSPVTVSATLLNRWRQPMRTVDPMGQPSAAITQFDLPLAGLAPGEYTLRLSVAAPGGIVSEHLTFRVQG